VVDTLEIEPAERPTDHEADVAPAGATSLKEAAEGERVERLTLDVEQRDESALWNPALHLVILADLDQLKTRVTREQFGVMLDIVNEG